MLSKWRVKNNKTEWVLLNATGRGSKLWPIWWCELPDLEDGGHRWERPVISHPPTDNCCQSDRQSIFPTVSRPWCASPKLLKPAGLQKHTKTNRYEEKETQILPTNTHTRSHTLTYTVTHTCKHTYTESQVRYIALTFKFSLT